MASQWEIDVDVDRCIGSGMCAGTAPKYFIVSNDRKSRPRARVVDPDETLSDAAFTCPVEAITITEADSRLPVVPDDDR